MDVDLVALLIRVALGPMLIAHGWNKLRGPGGIAGTTRWFESLGLRPARLHAWVAAVMEIGVGLFVLMGVATGLACIGIVALMVVATLTDHRGKGYFIFRGGSEYTLLILIVTLAYATLGSGRWSFDHWLGIEHAGPIWMAAALVAGTGSALVVLAACYRPAESKQPV